MQIKAAEQRRIIQKMI